MVEFFEIVTHSEDETNSLGIKLASRISGDALIPIIGPLGVGKSVLVRGIARGMGYTGRVRSPSFTLERIYNTSNGELHHWDLYRLEGTSQVEPLFNEIRMQSGVRLIEWGERLEDFLSEDQPVITIEYTEDPAKRRITIDKRIALLDE